MRRFRDDNTSGYDKAALAELNAAFERIVAAMLEPMGETAYGIEDDGTFKSWQDSVAEVLLFRHDSGKRGADLTWGMMPGD